MDPQPSEPGGAASLTDARIEQVYTCLSVGTLLKDAAEYIGIPVAVVRARRRSDPAFARVTAGDPPRKSLPPE